MSPLMDHDCPELDFSFALSPSPNLSIVNTGWQSNRYYASALLWHQAGGDYIGSGDLARCQKLSFLLSELQSVYHW